MHDCYIASDSINCLEEIFLALATKVVSESALTPSRHSSKTNSWERLRLVVNT